ncbi:hypothetical protein BGZ76_006659 [Entomortierella beljakovae]|nr:hypothetical protein BGZ76_006659 [Entomortierella beljakovae]
MPPANLKVLISGGGIAGLVLATLLERAGINYEVYERATTIRPLGTALSIGPNVLPVFEQLGLLEEFYALAKENDIASNHNEKLEVTSIMSYGELFERTGYANHIISRPKLYNLLLSRIPTEKFNLGKRVASFEQHDDDESENAVNDESGDCSTTKKTGVTITFTDGTTAHGDILVGADGAYSSVRKSMYKHLQPQGKLPLADSEELPCSSICLVGQTDTLSTEKYPGLSGKRCKFDIVNDGSQPYTWMTFFMPDNTICWMVIEHLYLETNRTEIVKNEEWGPASTDAMIDKSKTLPLPSSVGGEGLTMGDLIDKTPRDRISQVALEGKLLTVSKFFETWYSGRTVLIGDGANLAIQDAIVLSNYLYGLADNTPGSINEAFEGFYKERVDIARKAHETSNRFRLMFRKGSSLSLALQLTDVTLERGGDTMRTAVILSLLLASIYEVSAIEKSCPFLAWSPQEFALGNGLNAQVISVEDLQKGVHDLVDCSHKAILVVDEPENQVHEAGTSLQIPFVDGPVDLESLAESLSQKCHTPLVDANEVDEIDSSPSVIYKKFSSSSVAENDRNLELIINEIRNKFQDEFLVLYSSSQIKEIPTKHRLNARQLPEEPTPTKQAGLFHNYTFFSQGIFMGLLVAVFVVPIVMIGISWNLQVQGPQRFEKKQN